MAEQPPRTRDPRYDILFEPVQIGPVTAPNRFYAVHPRRNDRFLRPSAKIEALFPEIDFTEFSFNRHMLSALESVSADRFGQVRRVAYRIARLTESQQLPLGVDHVQRAVCHDRHRGGPGRNLDGAGQATILGGEKA